MSQFDIPFAMPKKVRNKEAANAVWDIFLEHGVFRQDNPNEREYFVYAFQNDTMWEWRLGSWMSFGCKFRGGTWSVDIYLEDKTSETDEVLRAVNSSLMALAKKLMPDDWRPSSGYVIGPD